MNMTTFDGLDNRKDLMLLIERLGHGVSTEVARRRRAAVLQRIMRAKGNKVSGKAKLQPLGEIEGYLAAIAAGTALGVGMEVLMEQLEAEVRAIR